MSNDAWADEQGTVHLTTVEVPFSDFASPAARDEFRRRRRQVPSFHRHFDGGDIGRLRRSWDEEETLPALERARKLWPCSIETTDIGGVPAQIVTPADGVAPANRDRLLINLHGGGFIAGAGAGGLLEAVPIAATARIKVATLDYRLAPEHVFPAASEDIASAYRALLSRYEPSRIGFYGCSAGAVLSAEAMPWLRKEGLPCPGGIAMICGNAARMGAGDSLTLGHALGLPFPSPFSFRSYFAGADPNDPLVSPCASLAVLADFPPTLLISAGRDFFLSHTTYMHRRLLQAGVQAELCIWDGLWHGFVWSPELPEAQEAFGVVARFFDRHLAA